MYDMLDEVVGVRESRKETGVNEIDPGQVKKVIGPVSRTCLRFPIIDKITTPRMGGAQSPPELWMEAYGTAVQTKALV